jgi:hypothetical protein
MYGEVPIVRGFNRLEEEIIYLQELLDRIEDLLMQEWLWHWILLVFQFGLGFLTWL